MGIWNRKPSREPRSYSKTKLLIGAGGLLLFIIGLKRSHRLDDEVGPELVDGETSAGAGTTGGPVTAAHRSARPFQ